MMSIGTGCEPIIEPKRAGAIGHSGAAITMAALQMKADKTKPAQL
jgi:hypothetical protein